MRKLNLFLFTSLMAIFALSCSDKEVGGTDEPGGQEGELGYLSFGLLTEDPSAYTRTGTTNAGTENEREVKEVMILLFDASTRDLKYRFDLDASATGGAVFTGADVATGSHVVSATQNRFTSVARQIVRADYQMVVLANAKTKLSKIFPNDLVLNQTKLEDVQAASMEASVSAWTTDGFFMSNANGVIPIKSNDLPKTAPLAESNPISVKLDRAVAKVAVTKDFPDTYTKEGNRIINDKGDLILDVKYGINMVNKYSFPIRNYAYFAYANSGNTESYAGEMETYATSIQANRKWIYATDVNYGTYIPEDFYRLVLPGEGNQQPDPLAALPDKTANPDYQYLFENTITFDEQAANNFLDYTTHVVVTANVFPNGFTEGSNYYTFINNDGEAKAFTHEEAVQWVSTGSFPAGMEGLEQLLSSPESEFIFEADSEPVAYRVSNGVTFHYEGLNIYRIPIRHFPSGDNVADPRREVYGYYGVVRNNIYSVVIKTLDNTSTGEFAFLSADISVNEWYVRPDQEEGL